MNDKFAQWESDSRRLDTSADEMKTWMESVSRYATDFLRDLPGTATKSARSSAERFHEPVPGAPKDFADVLARLGREVLLDGLNASSGKYMAYVPGGGVPTAAVGDFLAALTNRYSGNYGACPAAAEIENATLRWMRTIVGFPEKAWGTLTSGGSLAAVTALVAARDARAPAERERSTIYLTSECHHSIAKALHIVGLGHLPRRAVAVDAGMRMSTEDLRRQIEADRAAGKLPWLVFASAGTVSSGSVDPLDAIADIAAENKMWFHIDAAYGGFFRLTARGQQSLSALGRADSIVLDPHKGLFQPYGLGAVLVRDAELLHQSFSFHPPYLADLPRDESPSEYGPELTRHFRGLRLWVSLQVHGIERFRAALEEKLALAEWAYGELSQVRGLTMGPRPDLSIVTFRLSDDAATQRLLGSIQSGGVFFNSSTRLNGQLYLRLCILHFRTHREEVAAAVREIKRLVESGYRDS